MVASSILARSHSLLRFLSDSIYFDLCVLVFFFFFFFFSSRRRHTRFDCDWSSDVCSSDLPGATPGAVAGAIVTQALVVAAGGIAAGVAGAVFVVRLVRSQLFGVSPLDPTTLVVASIVFIAVTEIGRASCREGVGCWGVAVG